MGNQSKFLSAQVVYNLDASLNNLTEIKTTLGSAEKQTFFSAFTFDANPAGNLKINFTVPSGATMTGNYIVTEADTSGAGVTGKVLKVGKQIDFTTPLSIAVYDSTVQAVQIWGTIKANGTAGDVQMQAAQDTSNGNDTTIYEDLIFNVFNAN